MHDFSQDDYDDFEIDVTQEKTSKLAALARSIVKKEVYKSLIATIAQLSPSMKARDADEIKIKKDKMMREEAQKTAAAAHEKTGAVKKQIFDEALQAEAAFKKDQAEKAA